MLQVIPVKLKFVKLTIWYKAPGCKRDKMREEGKKKSICHDKLAPGEPKPVQNAAAWQGTWAEIGDLRGGKGWPVSGRKGLIGAEQGGTEPRDVARGLCAATVISHTTQLHHPAAAKHPNIHNITRGPESTGTCTEAEVLVAINLDLSFKIGELAGVQRGFYFYRTSMLYCLSTCTASSWHCACVDHSMAKARAWNTERNWEFFKDLLTVFLI